MWWMKSYRRWAGEGILIHTLHLLTIADHSVDKITNKNPLRSIIRTYPAKL